METAILRKTAMMYSTELELIFHKYDGLAFQSFFNELMALGITGFCPVRQRNDGGNDGFVENTGTFYQVFAPEAVTSSTIRTASSKMIDDFDKLAKNWHYLIELKEYVFVINDKFKGSDSNLIRRVTQLGDDRGLKTKILTAFDLVEIFHSNLTDIQKEMLISRHSLGGASDPALKVAARMISNRLPIEKWKQLDEQLSFSSIFESDLNILSEVRSALFSMDFNANETSIINELVNSINNLVNLFYSTNTTERNGERKWDNSWKRIQNNPRANYYVKEQEKWESQILDHTFKLCKRLNIFCKFVRKNQIPDFLQYKNYTVVRRKKDTLNEYVEIQP